MDEVIGGIVVIVEIVLGIGVLYELTHDSGGTALTADVVGKGGLAQTVVGKVFS
jgi:hypothetical protein